MAKPNIGELPGQLYELLKDLEADERVRVVSATLLLFGDSPAPWIGAAIEHPAHPVDETSPLREPQFSKRQDLPPKQFIHEKDPRTDVERVTCLAYYFTHFRDTPAFKTLDISRLNTEAAQRKLSNAAAAIGNASRRGLITAAGKGLRQISAVGEQFVDALPDRDEAKVALSRLKPRRTAKSKTKRTKRL